MSHFARKGEATHAEILIFHKEEKKPAIICTPTSPLPLPKRRKRSFANCVRSDWSQPANSFCHVWEEARKTIHPLSVNLPCLGYAQKCGPPISTDFKDGGWTKTAKNLLGKRFLPLPSPLHFPNQNDTHSKSSARQGNFEQTL